MSPTVLFCIASIACLDANSFPDFTKLSQQSLMELLARHLASAFEDEKSNFLDIAEWKGVECDKDGQVTSIKWDSLKAIGIDRRNQRRFIDFRWIPKTVRHLEVHRIQIDFFDAIHLPSAARKVVLTNNVITKISGVLETESLPTGLEFIDVSANVLTGSVDCTALPKYLETFAVDRNNFSGSLTLTYLPNHVRVMLMHANAFSGEIDLSKLPHSLGLLTLHENTLEGSLWLDGLSTCQAFTQKSERQSPTRGRTVFIHSNRFRGQLSLHYSGEAHGKLFCVSNRFTSIDWSSLKKIVSLDANSNAVSGTLSVWAIPGVMRYLNLAHNALSGSLNIAALGPQMKTLNLSHNALAGTLEFTSNSLERLFLQNNRLEGVIFDRRKRMAHIQQLFLRCNKIQQDVVRLADFGPRLSRIDLRGNDIKRCLTRDGDVIDSPLVLYDNGTHEQRCPQKGN